jgi:hypothetical protein
MSPLMPRFELGDADMAALIDYLKNLDPRRVPGVAGNALHFATIIAPDADPLKRRAMLAVLEQYFAERNARQMSPAPRVRGAHAFMVHRRWELHVWELKGEPSTWQEQLRERLTKRGIGLSPGWRDGPGHQFTRSVSGRRCRAFYPTSKRRKLRSGTSIRCTSRVVFCWKLT